MCSEKRYSCVSRMVFVLLLLLSVSLASAQSDNVEHEFKQKLERMSEKNSTISSLFTQTKKVKNIGQPVNSRGEFFCDSEGRMALLYTEPNGDKVVLNGEQMMVVTQGRKFVSNALSNPMMAQISHLMKACMSGDINDLGRGWSMQVEKKDLCYRVQLIPEDRRIKRYVSAMVMVFEEVNLTLEQLRIDETSGGYTEYCFVKKRINQPIDECCFKVE